MMKALTLAIAVLWIGSAAPSVALQSSLEEIVVTGSRVRAWDPDEIPAVRLDRRADNLIVEVRAVGDTRDATERRSELIATLRGVARAAVAHSDIDLSIEVDGALVPLTENMVSTLTLGVEPGRVETSVTTLIVKTPIRATDDLDAASGRIETFVRAVPKVGRTLVTITGDWELSIVNPTQYRTVILDLMAADARRTTTAFGADYAVEAEGLENRVTWIQSGPLELSLFIPYRLRLTPRP